MLFSFSDALAYSWKIFGSFIEVYWKKKKNNPTGKVAGNGKEYQHLTKCWAWAVANSKECVYSPSPQHPRSRRHHRPSFQFPLEAAAGASPSLRVRVLIAFVAVSHSHSPRRWRSSLKTTTSPTASTSSLADPMSLRPGPPTSTQSPLASLLSAV